MAVYGYLPARILYNWSDIYSNQLESGKDYHTLQPVISIWLLAENLFSNTEIRHHRFQMADIDQKRLLNDHCAIHVLELQKWVEDSKLSQKDKWAVFFRNAQYWDSLPANLNLPEFIQAMATLKRFSEKERNYHLYQARQNYIREQKSQQIEHERAMEAQKAAIADKEAAVADKEAAIADKQAAIAEREAALAEREAALMQIEEERAVKEAALREQQRLKQLLLQAKINPEADTD